MKTQAYLALLLALGCRAAVHGNGVIEAGEQCDDGNTNNGDGCNISCELETCGDGLVNDSGLEQCDDGNQDNDDGCSSLCKKERCGDGVVNNLKEQCDDDNVENKDGCNFRCQFEFCGDGIVNNKTETCDDGNRVDGDGCQQDCQLFASSSMALSEPDWELLFPTGARATFDSFALLNRDINKDRIIDLVGLDFTGGPQVFLGDGGGIFAKTPLHPSSLAAYSATDGVLGDFNGDGWVDLLTNIFGADGAATYLGNATFDFDDPTVLSPTQKISALAAADINSDGKDDAVLATEDELRLFVGTGRGLKASTRLSKEAFQGVAVADFNGDSYSDVVGLSSDEVLFFMGSKGGTIGRSTSISVAHNTRRITIGDTNNDGVSDLIAAGERLVIVSYQGTLGFIKIEGPALTVKDVDAVPVAACDVDRDGNLDVALLESDRILIFVGSGKGTFKEKYRRLNGSLLALASLTSADLNQDGVCDLIEGWNGTIVWFGKAKSK